MRRLVAAILVTGCLAAPAPGQDAGTPEALQAARELTSVISVETVSQLAGVLISQNWPAIEKNLADNLDAQAMKEVRAEFDRSTTAFIKDVMEEMPAIYARYFTVQELQELTAFHKSPLGQKSMQMTPRAMMDLSAVLATRIQTFQNGLATRVQAIAEKHKRKN